jgi:hypothetical protein
MCEPEMAEWLAALPGWDFATLELGVNMVDWATPEEFEQRVRRFIDTMHRALPERPLLVIDIFPNRADWMLDSHAIPAVRTPLFREIVHDIVNEIGHPNVRAIEARDIFRDPCSGLSSDLLHPSDEGHLAIGTALGSRVASLVHRTGP